MPTPRAIGVGGTGKPHRRVIQYDLARVRLVDALQDAHQRRLAGAVAADDGVDRSRRGGEVDAVVGDDRAEPARQTPTGAEANLGARRHCLT